MSCLYWRGYGLFSLVVHVQNEGSSLYNQIWNDKGKKNRETSKENNTTQK